MFVLLLGAALAAPPEGVDLDDLDHWEAASQQLLDGPPGCWDLSGTLEIQMALFTPPGLFKRAEKRTLRASGAFGGRLDGGTWRSFDYTLAFDEDSELKPDDDEAFEVPVFPLIGEIDQAVVNADGADPDEPVPDEGSVQISVGSSSGVEVTSSSSQAMNLIDGVMDAISPSATTSYAQWFDEPAGVKLLQDAPVDESPNAPQITLETFFPGGGPHATEIDVIFPPPVQGPGGADPDHPDRASAAPARQAGRL